MQCCHLVVHISKDELLLTLDVGWKEQMQTVKQSRVSRLGHQYSARPYRQIEGVNRKPFA